MFFRGGGYFPSSYISSISNITSQNVGNNLNDKANADTSDTETCLSSESEQNKANEYETCKLTYKIDIQRKLD